MKIVQKYRGKIILRRIFAVCFGLAAVCILLSCILGFGWFRVSQIQQQESDYESRMDTYVLVKDMKKPIEVKKKLKKVTEYTACFAFLKVKYADINKITSILKYKFEKDDNIKFDLKKIINEAGVKVE